MTSVDEDSRADVRRLLYEAVATLLHDYTENRLLTRDDVLRDLRQLLDLITPSTEKAE